MTVTELSPEVRPQASPAYRRRWWALLVLCGSLLVISLDNTVLNVALPTLARSLHASSTQLQWVVDAYTVVFAGLLLTSGNLGDRLGRKWNLLAGLGLFGTASVLSAFAESADALIGFRALMGIGAALIMPATLSIINSAFPDPRERAKAIGFWSGTTGLGIAAGPLAGGALLTHFWWGSVFLINAPIATIAIAAAMLLVPNSKAASPPRPDPTGVVLSIVGFGTLVWAIIEAPTLGWSSIPVISGFLAGGAALAAFVSWERRCSHPMLNLKLFSNRGFSGANTAVALAVFGLFGAGFLLTQYLQFVLGYSPLQAGIRILPVAVGIALAAPASTVLMRRFGTRVMVASGLTGVGAGLFWMAGTSPSSSYWHMFWASILLGVGLGSTMAPATNSIMGALEKDEAGVGAAMDETTIQVGGGLGVAVLGSVFVARYGAAIGDTLTKHGVPIAVAHILRSSVGAALVVAHHLNGDPAARLTAAIHKAFISGMDEAVLLGAAFTILGAVVAALLLPPRGHKGADDS